MTTEQQVVHGDCLEMLKKLKDNCIDSVVTDPPYELTAAKRTKPAPYVEGSPLSRHRVGVNGDNRPVGGFMGKEWDGTGIAFNVDLWKEVLRVIKPGGMLLAFGGTRTYHRMACAIEDAGFELRDCIIWHYFSGFPKSLSVGNGYGTALKPSYEPIVMARKKLEGTVASNFAKYGTGVINIDGCRIKSSKEESEEKGRWPSNTIFQHADECEQVLDGFFCADGCPVAELDRQSGNRKSGSMKAGTYAGRKGVVYQPDAGRPLVQDIVGSEGGASRFVYVVKPSRTERDAGLDHFPTISGGEATDRDDGSPGTQSPRAGSGRNGGVKNFHPTLKSITLLRYLVRMSTKPEGVVLDPFCGSGSTGCAAALEGMNFLGIEKENEYIALAEARIAHWRAVAAEARKKDVGRTDTTQQASES